MSEHETSLPATPDPDQSLISNTSSQPDAAAPAEPPPDEASKPSESTTTTTGTPLKRRRNGDAEKSEVETLAGAPSAKRRVKAIVSDVIYRIVVPSRQIGKVIGKGGHRIQKIRDDAKATIKIADAVSRNEERVIIISSKGSDNVFSDAENALHQIVSLILKDDGTEAEKDGAGHVATNTIRLLIAGSQAGALIGSSGQNIANLRSTSGASITVLDPNQLPPCASAHESDRIVQISGDVPAVLRAVVEIGCQLKENPPKQVISNTPAYNHRFHSQPQHYMDPISAEYLTLDLMVPENLVGGLIGRFGANISRIRNESGANIKVHGGRGQQTQRQISLSGDTHQVTFARQRVDEYVYAELMRQAGAQLQPPSGPVHQVVNQHPIHDGPNSLYQGYGHPPPPHGLYPNSNYEPGIMAPPPPPPYGSTATDQAPPPPPPPPYYSYPPYPTPQF